MVVVEKPPKQDDGTLMGLLWGMIPVMGISNGNISWKNTSGMSDIPGTTTPTTRIGNVCPTNMWSMMGICKFPETGVPQSSSISIGFSIINQLFGVSPYMQPPFVLLELSPQ